MGRLDYSIELPRRTIDDVQMPNLPDHLTYIEPGYGIGDMLAEIAKNIRAGRVNQIEENLKLAQAQNYQAEAAARQAKAAQEQKEWEDLQSGRKSFQDTLRQPGALDPANRGTLAASALGMGNVGPQYLREAFGFGDKVALQDQKQEDKLETLEQQNLNKLDQIEAQLEANITLAGTFEEKNAAKMELEKFRQGSANYRARLVQAGANSRFRPQTLTTAGGQVVTVRPGLSGNTATPLVYGAPATQPIVSDGPAGPLPMPTLPARMGQRAEPPVGTGPGKPLTGPLVPPTDVDNQPAVPGAPQPAMPQPGSPVMGPVKGQGSNKTLQDYASTYFKKAQQDANTEHGANTTKAATIVEMFKKDVGSQEQAALAGNPDAQVVYDKELIRALAKLTDPDSVIRESEQKFYGETGSSLAQKVDGWMAYINGGPNRVIYQPGQREQMRQQLEAIVEFWRDKQASRDAMVKKNFHYYMSGRGTPEEVEAAWQGVSKEGSMGGRKMTADEWLKENP